MTSNLSVAKPQKRTAKNADTPLGRVIAAAGSQKALAAKLGVTKGAVSQWATGRYELPVKQVLAIVNAYGDVVTCAELRPDVGWPSDLPQGRPRTLPPSGWGVLSSAPAALPAANLVRRRDLRGCRAFFAWRT